MIYQNRLSADHRSKVDSNHGMVMIIYVFDFLSRVVGFLLPSATESETIRRGRHPNKNQPRKMIPVCRASRLFLTFPNTAV